MATKLDADKLGADVGKTTRPVDDDGSPTPPHYENAEIQEEKTYAYDDSRKLGVTGAVFLILNKMIGTGSTCGLCQAIAIAYVSQFSRPRPESSLLLARSA